MKANDIGGRGGTATVKLTSPGERNVTDYRPDGALDIPVTPVTPPTWATGGDEPKTWSLNRTSEDTLLSYIGENTEDWVNEVIRVNALRQNVMGNMRDVLYSEALEANEQPTKQPMKKKTTPKKTPTPKEPTPDEEEPLNVSDETATYLKYHETMIGEPIDSADWNTMPPSIKKELASLNLINYDKGAPVLSTDARQLLP